MDSDCNTECEAPGEETLGVNIVVANASDDCPSVIGRDGILVQEDASTAAVRSGSVDELIEVSPQDHYGPIYSLLTLSGENKTIIAKRPPQATGELRVITKNRSFYMLDANLPTILPTDMESFLASVHILGGNNVYSACSPGAIIGSKLIKIPSGFEFPELTAVDDEDEIYEDDTSDLNVVANDVGDSVTLLSVTEPSHGTAVIDSETNIVYTPDEGWTGDDTFSYTVVDQYGQEDTALVTITTLAIPPLIAVDDDAETDDVTPITIDAAANDSGHEFSITSVSDPAHGTATVEDDGTITYTPEEGFTGDVTFAYIIQDIHGQSDIGFITVACTAAGIPTCYDGSIEYHFDASLLAGSDLDLVATWPDQSGNARDATQGTSGAQPKLRTAARNGLNVLEFDGTDDCLLTSAFATAGLSNCTLYAVLKPDTAGGAVFAHKASSAGAAGEEIDIFTSATEINAKLGSVRSSVAYTGGTGWLLVRLQADFSDTLNRIYLATVNGATVDSSGSYTLGTVGTNILRIGCRNHGFGDEVFFDGQIAEILCVAGYDSGCADQFENYLKSKWGFSY